jgi:uncharacterized protein
MIVSNSSPLINLSAINQLELLRMIYGEIAIPYAVWDEVVVKGKGQPGVKNVKNANWIKKIKVDNVHLVESLALTLDYGEAEAIALAKERNAEILLIDDKLARVIAKHLGIRYIGLLGVLKEAKSRGLITVMKPYMHSLRTVAGFWVAENVYKDILSIEGEWETNE